MDIENISFYKPLNFIQEYCKLVYFSSENFSMYVAPPNVLYIVTSVCIVRINDAYNVNAPSIIPIDEISPLDFVCYYSNGANIKIYVSASGVVYLTVKNIYIQFRHVKYGFLTALIKKVREFAEKK